MVDSHHTFLKSLCWIIIGVQAGQIGDINHLIFTCALNQIYTNVLMAKLIELKLYSPLNTNNILESENLEAFIALFNFLKSAKIIN